jgi:hypothetical protein
MYATAAPRCSLSYTCGGLLCIFEWPTHSAIGWFAPPKLLPCSKQLEHDMRKFHSIAALCGDGLRPELKALFDRLAIDPYTELFVRSDGMTQSGPDPASETKAAISVVPKRVA